MLKMFIDYCKSCSFDWIIIFCLSIILLTLDSYFLNNTLLDLFSNSCFSTILTLYSVFIASYMIASPYVVSCVKDLASYKGKAPDDWESCLNILSNIRAAITEGTFTFIFCLVSWLIFKHNFSFYFVNFFFATLGVSCLINIFYIMLDCVNMINVVSTISLYCHKEDFNKQH